MATVKGIFLMNLAIVGVILALAIYQVPQPWRAILVAWLLFLVPSGTFILRLIRHHYQYRKLRVEQDKKRPLRTKKGKRNKKHSLDVDGNLKIIHADRAGSGRHTI